jgi:hypothetical protein
MFRKIEQNNAQRRRKALADLDARVAKAEEADRRAA